MTSDSNKPTEQTLDQAIKIAQAQYVASLNYAHKMMNDMSARNIQRALISAIDYGITDSKIKFVHEKEATLGGILAKILDLRTILQAGKLNKMNEQEKKENGEKE